MKSIKIPEATIIRLSVYSRYLDKIDIRKSSTVSSDDIAQSVGVNPFQVRKDLAYFGEFGIRGVGYNVKSLNQHLLKLLNLNVKCNIALVGFGKLGHALALYQGFKERGFVFTCIFDSDPQKIGTKVNGVEVISVDRLEEIVEQNHSRIGIISTPAKVAQEIANSLVKARVQSILNFAPVNLNIAPEISLRNVDLAVNLEFLTFNFDDE